MGTPLLQAASSVALLAVTVAAHAEPLPVRDLNPLLSGYELPPALPSTYSSRSVLSASFATSNTSLNQHSAQDSLQLDAEMQRWQLTLVRPLSDNLSLRIELPYVSVSGGKLDNFIESFHQTFSLPNGNRNTWPEDRLLVQHAYAGNTDYQLTQATHGMGDLAVRIGWNMDITPTRTNTLWFTLKLPTGNANKLSGSGTADMTLSLSTAQQLNSHFTSQQQLSASLLEHGQRLGEQQKTLVWTGSFGVDAALTPHWSAIMQLDGHSKVFATELRGLGNALQFSFGPRYQTSLWQTSLLLSEDIAVDSAPDVQFQIDVTRRF